MLFGGAGGTIGEALSLFPAFSPFFLLLPFPFPLPSFPLLPPCHEFKTQPPPRLKRPVRDAETQTPAAAPLTPSLRDTDRV